MAESPQTTLDAFSRAFPLPYRISFTIVLGIWAWGVNLHGFSLYNIDAEGLIKYTPRVASNGTPLYRRVYRVATLATVPLLASLLVYWNLTRNDEASIRTWEILPQSYLVGLLACTALPLRRISSLGRRRLLATLMRISVGGIAETTDGKFGDVLLADALISYSKVLGDLFISTCMLFTGGSSCAIQPRRNCGGTWLTPMVIAVPSCIRFRQCLIEYFRTRGINQTVLQEGFLTLGGQHLANAAKYLSALPVIFLSALPRSHDHVSAPVSEVGVHRLWLFFALFNSLFSFYWDVSKDWDLTLLVSHERSRPEHAWGLRRRLLFRSSIMYYGAVAIDLLLRFSWSFGFISALKLLRETERGAFILVLLEIFRRWLWVFLRTEAEELRLAHGSLAPSVPLQQLSLDSNKSIDI